MKKILVCAALAFSLNAVPALAKGKPSGRGNDKHEAKSEKWKDKDKDKDRDKDDDRRDRDRKKDWGDRDRDRDHGQVASNGRPPGWDKGKKTGWGNCDVPPGQAKKQGCNSSRTRRPIIVARRDRDDRHRPTRRHTTTTTTTTTTTSPAPTKRGTHPFSPVLRQKQQGGSTDAKGPRQSVK
jgi:Ni/Co efflux regulator RcnB